MEKIKTSKDIITPQKKFDIPYSSVKFSKSWSFFESYIGKTVKLSYDEGNKLIYKWDDLISFFQFWNKYPGNDIKNIFLMDIIQNFFLKNNIELIQ